MPEIIQNLDASALLFIQEHLRFAPLNPIMILVGTLGNAGLIWIGAGLLLVVFPKTRKCGVMALTSLLLCYLLNNILIKNIVARPRPDVQIPELRMLIKCPSDWSFPSGHSCSSFAAAGSLWRGMDRSWNAIRFAALILALLISFSRLYVGVHYPTDVLAGAIIGLAGSWTIRRFGSERYDRIALRRRRR